MQGCELLTVLPFTHASDAPMFLHDEETDAFVWPLLTPPLRVEADSLQHWLDLNA